MSQFARFWNQSFFIPKPALTEKNLPDQSGRVFIVTGGYVGCGRELGKILYQRNGTVYLAGRSKAKADTAIGGIKKEFPNSKGRLEFLQLDLADLSTIKASVKDFTRRESRLDVLTNNAGVMTPPAGSLSAQKYELQIATNCMGPYLFTKLLAPLLQRTAELPDTPAGSVRVTWAASIAVDMYSARGGGMDFNKEGNYVADQKDQRLNYGASKVGNVFLASEFARRYAPTKGAMISNSWNPGNLRTELQRHTPSWILVFAGWMMHPPVFGGYTELFAGWGEEAGRKEKNGAYIAPWGRFGTFRGDIQAEIGKGNGKAEKFWEWCERETKAYC